MRHPNRAFALAAAVFATFALQARQLVLENSRTKLVLDSQGNYAPVNLTCAATGVNLLAPQAVNAKSSPWEITFKQASGNQLVSVTAATPCDNIAASQRGDAVTVTWKGLKIPQLAGTASFEMTVALKDNGDTSWTYRLEASAQGAVLWQVKYPIVGGVRAQAEDYLAYPYYLGRLAKNPTKNKSVITLNYPQPCSMQFCAYWGTPDKRLEGDATIENGWQPDLSDATGLYFAAEDPDGRFKHLCISTHAPTLDFWFVNFHSLKAWPLEVDRTYSCTEQLPYPVIVQPYKGDLFTACAKYGDWAKGQPWCAAGRMPEVGVPMGTRQDAIVHWKSEYQRNAAYWTKYYDAPYKVLGEWGALQDWLRVPSPSHYYRYNIAPFDDNYPEHLPGRPYLLGGMRAAKRMGVAPQPYNNGVIWDMDTQSWLKEHGADAMRIEPGGNHRVWDIHGEYFAFMCPFTKQWQDKMRETSRKMIWEHEMPGVYLDCLAATASSMCYNPKHGHTLHGGDYFTKGNRKLMADLRRDIRAITPDAGFFAEEICEQYLDCMDGFLTLDYLRSGYLRPGEQVFPLFNCVYNPYTLDYGSDASLGDDESNFRLQMGRLLVWGSTPLMCSGNPKPPAPGDANSEFLKNLVQGYHQYGRKLTFNADMVRISRRPFGSKSPKSAIDVQAKPLAAISYGDWSGKHKWNGPAVLSGAFRKGGTITLLLVNVTGEAQTACITVNGAIFDGAPARTARVLWPKQSDLIPIGENTLQLPVNSTAIVTFCKADDAPAPEPAPLLEKDWHLVHQKAAGPFPTIPMPQNGSLLACDDAIVDIDFHGSPSAHMLVFDNNGRLVPRTANDPAETARPIQGVSSDRSRTGQAFALLHELPATVKDAARITVISGDKDYLAAVAAPAAPGESVKVTLGYDAIVACGGKDARFIGWKHAGQPIQINAAIGAASLSKTTLNEAFAASTTFGIDAQPLKAAADEFLASPDDARLARLSCAVKDWYAASAALPALFAPRGAGYRLLAQIAALQAPFLANPSCPAAILADDDWLSPAIPKPLRLVGADSSTVVVPLGDWATAAAVSPIKDGVCTLTVTDAAYVERLVPVVAWTALPHGGWHPAVTWLECNRPYELQTPSRPVNAISGMTVTTDVVLNNWSTIPVTVALKGTIASSKGHSVGSGFTVVCGGPVAVAPRSKAKVNVTVAIPRTAVGGTYELAIAANHLDDKLAETLGVISLNVLEAMSPLDGAATASAPADTTPRLRGVQQYVAYARAGETLKLTLAVPKCTIYKDSMAWRLLDADMKELLKGTVLLGETRDVACKVQKTGMLMLVCDTKLGAGTATSSTHPLSDGATAAVPMQLFCSKITRYFYVKAEATSFKLGATDGGMDEPAAITVISPTGRTALDRSGNWTREVVTIPVSPDEAGKPWTIVLKPVQDLELSISDGAESWLARTPESVLRGTK